MIGTRSGRLADEDRVGVSLQIDRKHHRGREGSSPYDGVELSDSLDLRTPDEAMEERLIQAVVTTPG